MIGYPRESHQPGEQQELVLRSLDDMEAGRGGDAQRFYRWAEAWVRDQVREHGEVWTDDLNLAAKAAHMEPPNEELKKSIYGTFWASRARVIGIRRDKGAERANRNPDSNGRPAKRWVPE